MRYGCRAHDFGTHPAEEFAALLQERGYNAAQLAMDAGIEMVITNGENMEAIYDIVEGKDVGTRFAAL